MKRITMNDLETMTTHEVAELLTNLAQLLHHLPEVQMAQLKPTDRPPIEAEKIAANVRRQPEEERPATLPDWVEEM